MRMRCLGEGWPVITRLCQGPILRSAHGWLVSTPLTMLRSGHGRLCSWRLRLRWGPELRRRRRLERGVIISGM